MLAHFIVSDDVERSRRFYTEVLGGRVAYTGPGGLTYVALANSWIIINVGGGPTDDKPSVTLDTPRDPDRVSSFLNIQVKDIHALYAEWSARGAQFLTPPKQHQYEIRCYIRDPDGHQIEVGQTPTQRETGRPLTGRQVRAPAIRSERRDPGRTRRVHPPRTRCRGGGLEDLREGLAEDAMWRWRCRRCPAAASRAGRHRCCPGNQASVAP
ncbi:VOC family protein [Streptomyces mirabilis]|uniref:VOC family protein n=1 Tax=Streptomyces mirabilis TaxID=68239 RepID=UPI0031BB5CF9